jgi:DNA-binding transcriptional LysR family regulator
MIDGGVELREIRTFLVLCEELHFARASERLGLTPSRVSQIIRTLEAQVGGRLFDRTSRQVALTPIGQRLRDDLTRPYAQIKRGLDHAREAATGIAGPLRIGMYLPINGGPYLPQIIRLYTSRHPGTGVELVSTGIDRDDLEWLKAREVDIIATRLPASDPAVTVGPILSREPRVLVLSRDDPIAARDHVCLEDLADRAIPDVLALRRELVDALYPPATPSGRSLRRHVVRTMEELVLAILTGSVVQPTVESMSHYYSHPEFATVPMPDLPPSETALVWLTANRAPEIRAFRDAADAVLAHTELGARRSKPGRALVPPAAGPSPDRAPRSQPAANGTIFGGDDANVGETSRIRLRERSP